MSNSALCCVLLLALACCCIAEDLPLPDYQQSRDKRFDAVGYSGIGLSKVLDVCDGMEQLGQKTFGEVPGQARPISIFLKSNLQVPFRVTLQPDRSVHMHLRWNDATTFDAVCMAVANAWLKQRCMTLGWDRFSPPGWLELALGKALEVELRPGLMDAFREQALKGNPSSLNILMTSEASLESLQSRLPVDAFWLMKLVEMQSGSRSQKQKWFYQLLYTQERQSVIDACFGIAEPSQLREMRWAVGFQNIVRGRQLPVESMDLSRQMVLRLSRVVVELDASDRSLSGMDLMAHIGKPEVHAALTQSLDEVKVEIFRVSPVYRNAMISLGMAFDALLNKDTTAFVTHWQSYVSEMSSAIQLHSDVERLLDW